MAYIKEAWQRLKNIKHFHVILAVFVALVVCVIYFSVFFAPKNDKIEENNTQTFSTAEEYVNWLENRLNNVLSKISGAGKVSTIVTLESGFSYDYAKEIETRTSTTGDVVITSETVIMVGGEPVVVKQWYPVIKGIVVVSSGAKDFTVQMKLMEAVQTVLEIEKDDIRILS